MARKANPFEYTAGDPRLIARLIEGRKLKQITKVFTKNSDGEWIGIMIEVNHHVERFKQYLPAGPTGNGGYREKDLIQFFADPGGLRTIVAEDIIIN